MNYTPRLQLPSDQRISRLMLWLTLSIVWLTAHVLTLFAPHEATQELKRYARWTLALLALRAAKRVAFRKRRPRRGHIDVRRLTCRGAVGSALRRAFRAGSPCERAGGIYAAITNPERWIAYILARLTRRFTKLRRLPAPQRTKANAIARAFLEAASFNSS